MSITKSLSTTPELHTLIRQIAKGDEKAFMTLYDEMFSYISKYLYHQFGKKLTTDDINDVIQHTYATVWKKAKSFRGRHNNNSAKSWMRTIARNQALKIIKAKQKFLSLGDGFAGDSDYDNDPMSFLEYKIVSRHNTEEDSLNGILIDKILRICRKHFSKRDNEILYKHVVREDTYEKIGEEYGLTKPRIKQILDNIIHTLQRIL